MDVQAAERLLRANKCSLTPQRRAILRYLADNTAHPTAAQILEAVTREFPISSRATVYNTVALLRELGVLHEVRLPSRESRFDPNVEAHHHFHCTDCDALIDVPAADVSVELRGDAGGAVGRASVLFEGLCQPCTQRQAAAR